MSKKVGGFVDCYPIEDKRLQSRVNNVFLVFNPVTSRHLEP